MKKFEVVAGIAGSGKSYQLYQRIIKEAHNNPDKRYILIVPEQVASNLERIMIDLSESMYHAPGFFNIDIVGFSRFAYRVFEEFGVKDEQVLEEYEKTMALRIAAGRVKNDLKVYASATIA